MNPCWNDVHSGPNFSLDMEVERKGFGYERLSKLKAFESSLVNLRDSAVK